MIREVVLTRINLFFLGLLALVMLCAFVAVPPEASIPVHWGISGEADGFAARDQAFLMMPVVVVAVLALFAAILTVSPGGQVKAGKASLSVVLSALIVLFLTIQTGMLLIGLGVAVNMVQMIALAMALLLILAGNVLPKSQPNRLAGLRLPWTLGDSGNWRATHRLVGVLMIASGLVLAAIALLPVQPAALLAALIIAVAVPLAIGTIYSYRLSKRA